MLVWLSKNVGYEKPFSVTGRDELAGLKSEPKYSRTDKTYGTKKGIGVKKAKAAKNNKRLNQC